MTARERVQRAFRHEEADRVPIYEQTVCTRVASEIRQTDRTLNGFLTGEVEAP